MSVSPIMIIGIIVYSLPIIFNIFRINLPGFVAGLGITLIIVGVGHSVWMKFKGD